MPSVFVVISVVIFFTVCFAEPEKDGPDFSSQRKNAVVVRQINTWEKETFISRDHLKAMETTAKFGRHRRSTVQLRQITDGSKLLQLFQKDHVVVGCELEHDPAVITQFLERFNFEGDRKAVEISLKGAFEESPYKDLIDWTGMENECRRLQFENVDKLEQSPDSRHEQGRNRRSIIFPKTTWCGVGNLSRGNDLVEGAHAEVDSCCRTHDFCPHTIDRFTKKYNYFNFRFYTISECECDESFRTCLRMIDTEAANEVGRVFFNILRMKCFVLRIANVCVERNWYGKCIRTKPQPTAEIYDATSYSP